MKVKEIVEECKSMKAELFLIEGNIDVLKNKKLYERIKNKEILYIDADILYDNKFYISISYDYGKMYNMSYILIKRTKDGIVAVGDKAMSCISSFYPLRKYQIISLDATKVFKNDYFVVGFVGTAFVDIDNQCISIEEVIKKLINKTKTINDFIKEFDEIYRNMSYCKYTKEAQYSFYLVDKNNAYIYEFKIDNNDEEPKLVNNGFVFNTPLYREEPKINDTDNLEEIAEKFKNAIAHTHENQKRELGNTFSVSKESDVVILKFKGEKDDKTN